MPLFRRDDGSKIQFDIVGLRERELEDISEMILRNGGEVKHDDDQPVKFTHRYAFVMQAYVSAKLFSVQFIRDCVNRNEIVDPAQYRIGSPMMYDDCVISHFLYGRWECCRSPNIAISHNSESERIPIVDISRDSESESESTIATIETARESESERIPIIDSSRDSESESQSSNEEPNLHRLRRNYIRIVVRELQRTRRQRRLNRVRGPDISATEEKRMLQYIFENRHTAESLCSLRVWKAMINDNVCSNRAALSLYKHFHYLMMPKIQAMANRRRFGQ